MADLATVLRNARSADPNIRNEAEKQLQNAESTNLSSYVYALSSELADESKPDDIRQLAGITLKNSFESKDEIRQTQLHQQWVAIDANVRAHVKGQIFRALSSASKPSRDTAAQVCAKVAKVELPKGLWPELIPELLKYMTAGSTEFLKQSTLLTLGYICEEIEPSVVEQQTNSILTAIVQGMRPEETNDEIKLAAAKALDNALEFAKNNFNNENERNYIMTVILQATQSNNLDVKVAGASCLAKVALLYYSQLPTHMQSIFDVTLKAIKGTEQPVALQAIEFWSTVCEEELYLQDQLRQTGDMGLAPTVNCHNFIKGALKYLVPLILETLTKQDEDAEEGTWDIAMAGATCLQLIAATVADEVVSHVVPFVQANIVNPNWHFREAAIMAFGCILDGPQDSIVPLIRQALPVLLQSMKDSSDPVKDTTAWTIGRVCQLHPIAIKGDIFPALLRILLDALPSIPRVAANVCWALHNIAESFGDEDPQQRPAETFLPYFTEVSKLLLGATERDDADENNLRSSAYEAINAFIDVSTPDCGEVVIALVGIFVDRLAKTFQKPILNADDRNEVSEVQAVLCGVLQTSTKKLGQKIKPAADKLMELYLTVFNNKTAAVQEEALMAIGALANAVEADFERYMSAFFPFLLLGLRNYQEYQVCSVAVGVVGDASRAVLRKFVPFCDEIVRVLLEDLQNPQLHRAVKPPILSCFADIALAIGQDFVKYLGVVMGMLQNAATTNVNKDDDDMVDSLNELREAIFEAFTGIIQGLHTDQQAEQIAPYAANIVAFAAHVLSDDTSSDDVIRSAVTVLGDVGLTLGPAAKNVGLNNPQLLVAVKKAATGDAPKSTRETVKWVEDVIRKL